MADLSELRRTAVSAPSATLSLRIGKAVVVDAGITSGGLLATAALVAGILLSTAAIVSVATRPADRRLDRAN